MFGFGDSPSDLLTNPERIGGDTIGTLTGAVGAAAGGATGVLTRGDLSGFKDGWTAGASFSPVGHLGTDARVDVRAAYERLDRTDTPGALKGILTALGPAQTAEDAWFSLASAGVAGGLAARAAARGVTSSARGLTRFAGKEALVTGALGAGLGTLGDLGRRPTLATLRATAVPSAAAPTAGPISRLSKSTALLLASGLVVLGAIIVR